MSGFDNEVVVSIGERLEPSTAQAIGLMQQSATDVARINHTGNPEGVVSANPSSLSHDPVTGNVYIKQTGTGNTGWVQNASLITGLAGTVLQGQGIGVAPAYSTATYPSVATGTGTILRANGTNWVASTATYPNTVAAGDMLYASATNVLSNLATAVDGKHLTIVSGLPTWSTPTFPNTAPAAGTFLRGNGTNWAVSTATIPNTSAQGDLLISSAANTWTSLAKDTNATRYLSNQGTSNNPSWNQVNVANGVTGILPVANGGTNASSFATSNGIVKYDGTRLVTSTATIDASNRYINASQPCASAYVFSTLSDVTGDGTDYPVVYDQEAFDQANNFNIATGLFTCPIQGFYLVDFHLAFGDIASGHTTGWIRINLVSGFGSVNNQSYFNPFAIATGGNSCAQIHQVVKMQAGGTIGGSLLIQGGAKSIDIFGAAGGFSQSYITIMLLWGY